GEAHDVELGLTDTDRLDEDEIEAERVEQMDDLARRTREPAVSAARREAPDEHPLVEEMRLHADAVAEDRASRERARRIDRDDADGRAACAIARDQSIRQARLSRPRRAGDADD